MIGSHDSFTFEKSTSWIFNKGKRWWKTQGKSIQEQYAFGIRLFDIRVFRDGGRWRTCHGKVNLKTCFKDIEEICLYMQANCPEAIYRIVLEKGDASLFHQQANPAFAVKYPNLWRMDIKYTGKWLGEVYNNNQGLYDRGYKFALVDVWTPPAYELHGFLTARNFYKIDLRKSAMSINRGLEFFKDKTKLKAMLESRDELYFLDYCTNEY